MKELMCQYKYEQILDVTKTLVAKGVFEIDQESTLSYLAACKAAKRAKEVAEKGDDIAQSSGSGEEDTSALETLQSTVSKVNPPTTSEVNKSIAPSDIAVNHFASLLQEHLEASKFPSTTPVVSPSLETVKIAEDVFSEQSTVGSELDTEIAEALDSLRERENLPLRDKEGSWYEEYLEGVLFGSWFRAELAVQNPTEPISSAKAEVVTDEQDRKPSKVLFVSGIGRGINIKHLFKEFADVCPVNVDFDTSKRVAVIEFTDIEAATKALKAKHGVFLNGRALNCEFGSESSLHDQVGIPTIASEQPTDDHRDDESPIPKEIVVNEQFGTPSKFLHVVGIAKSVNIEHLFEEFADVSPVDISHVGSWPYGFFEFTDIEAATKAIKAKHGTFLCCKKLKCMFSRSENPFTKSVGIRTVASKQPIDDHGDEDSSVPEPLKVGDTISAPTTITTDIIAVSTGTTVGTVAQVPEEIMKEFVGEAPTEITEEAVRYAPTQTVADELMLSSEPDPLDQTASLRKIPKRQRKVKKAKAAQSMIKEPAPSIESRLDKSVFETLSESIRDQAETTTVEPPGATSDDEPLYDGGLYNESASSSSIDQATFHDLEKDDLVYEDEPSSSDELQSKAHQELLREPGLKKGPTVDRILPEIRQYATIPVPRTRAYYLPYSSQNRVLSGLQASLEQVCFRYLQRKHPELLKETPTRWAIDSAHAFELNRYICLLGGLIAPSPGVDLGPGGSQSLQALIKSIAGQRHHAVHRFRVDIEALRFWAVDAVRLAELLEDPEAARQFSSLVSSLEAQQDRIKAEKMKAEEDLLITVRELAAKRAELLRVEREAMTAYEAAHKQLPTRTS
ncbi:hypothetical protein KCV04_g7758, partial [Aureobasidium melanogenum]